MSGLRHQRYPKVQMIRRLPGSPAPRATPRGLRGLEPTQHFRTYFITRPTNTNTTMHYNIARFDERLAPDQGHPLLQHPASRTPPARVQQRHDALLGGKEIDRDAVGDGHREEHPGRPGRVTVHAIK